MPAGVSCDMLTRMQPSSQTASSPRSASFAGLLAALASPAANATDIPPASIPAWSSDDLSEEVTTLSYERALRAHARYKPADRYDATAAAAGGRNEQPATVAKPVASAKFDESAGEEARETAQAAAELERRRASVTIRLSAAECARLKQRAAEAGLTVSAYLRSCALEAEALRAQVKQALAELRTAGKPGTEGPSHPSGQKSPAPPLRDPGSEQATPADKHRPLWTLAGNKELKQRGNEGVKLTRVLLHIGNLCIGLGLSSGKSY